MGSEVEIKVDGKDVPLNDFIVGMTENLVRAIIASLKGADPKGDITIHVGPKQEGK
jgi:hypothetical protein